MMLVNPAHSAVSDASSEAFLTWNETILHAITEGPPRPTVISRKLFLVSAAQYDAWAVAAGQGRAYVEANRALAGTAGGDSQFVHDAVMAATHVTASSLWPAQQERFDQLMAQLSGTSAGNDLGRTIALNVLAARAEDGSNAANGYADKPSSRYRTVYSPMNAAIGEPRREPGGDLFDPNRWQPLVVPTGSLTDENGLPIADPDQPDSYTIQSNLTPHWGNVRTFGGFDPEQWLPPAPPLHGSDAPYVDQLGRESTNHEAWVEQFTEVVEYTALLEDRGKVIAEFWADGPRSETPPGHWNQLAQGVIYRDDLDLEGSIKLYFALNGALMDAAISAWHAKRVYDFIRPQSAIRHYFAGETIPGWGGPDQGTVDMPAEHWRPYQELTFITPPFAEYVSGHSTFSAAAAEVLSAFTGSETFFDGNTRIPQDLNSDGEADLMGQFIALPGSNLFENSPQETVILQWPTWQDAADEAGISRLYGGIHIQDGDLAGRELGLQVGQRAWRRAAALFNDMSLPQPAHSGHWYRGEEQSGDGVIIELTENQQMILSWMTYDQAGEQLWIVAQGDPDQAHEGLPAITTRGGRFGEAFDASGVNHIPFGSLAVRFDGCNQALVRYESDLGEFGSGEFAIERLSNVAGNRCRE